MASKSEYQRALDKIDAQIHQHQSIVSALKNASPELALSSAEQHIDALQLARVVLVDAFEEKVQAKAAAPKRTRKAKKETA